MISEQGLVSMAPWPGCLGEPDAELLAVFEDFGNHASDESMQMTGFMVAEICREDRPGNIVVLDDPEGIIVRLVVSVTRKFNRQPRRILVPASSIFLLSDWIKSADCVSPVDGYLTQDNHACYWLGMIALIHFGELQEVGRFVRIFRMLSRQLAEDASIIFSESRAVSASETVNSLADSFCMPVSACFTADGAIMLRKPWRLAANPFLSRALVKEFFSDDPLNTGIMTLMSANERFQLYYCARELVPFTKGVTRFVEIGSFAGGTFFEIAWAFERNAKEFQGIAIEPYGNPLFSEVIKMFGDRALHLKMNSHDAAPILANMFEDDKRPVLILIDGDHRYEAVCQDIMDYYPVLAPGGIIIFHDFLPPAEELPRKYVESGFTSDNEDIRRACLELMEGHFGLEPIELPLLYPGSLEQTMGYKPIIPGVYSTIRAYRKPLVSDGGP